MTEEWTPPWGKGRAKKSKSVTKKATQKNEVATPIEKEIEESAVEMDSFDKAVEAGLVLKSGAWFKLPNGDQDDITLGKGKPAALKKLEEVHSNQWKEIQEKVS